MTNKIYTAQEMRELSDAISGDLCDNGHRSVEYTYNDLIPVIDSLRQAADSLEREAAEKQSVTNCNRLGNVAKMREACSNISEYAKAAACHTEDAHLLGYINQIERWAEVALSEPPRNCDRPECATAKEAQEVWSVEDGGKTAYYEWLLATSTKGEAK